MQLHEMNLWQVMIFRLYILYNKHKMIKIGTKNREISQVLSQVLDYFFGGVYVFLTCASVIWFCQEFQELLDERKIYFNMVKFKTLIQIRTSHQPPHSHTVICIVFGYQHRGSTFSILICLYLYSQEVCYERFLVLLNMFHVLLMTPIRCRFPVL